MQTGPRLLLTRQPPGDAPPANVMTYLGSALAFDGRPVTFQPG